MKSVEADVEICGKCDQSVYCEQKAVACFTCKQKFHTSCQQVSDAKHELLSNETDNVGLAWFCKTCIRTTATMLQHVANLERRLIEIEEERKQEKHQMSVLQNLVKVLNTRMNSAEDKINSVQNSTTANMEEIDGIKDSVNCMLEEIPRTTSIEERFALIEDSLEQLSTIPSIESKLCQLETSESYAGNEAHSTYLELSMEEVANELADRQQRSKNLVIHNVPETNDHNTDVEVAKSIITEVTGRDVEIQRNTVTGQPRMYRLGRKNPSKVRSIKIHLNSKELREDILA